MKQPALRRIAIATLLLGAGALNAPAMAEEQSETMDEVIVQAAATDAIDVTHHLQESLDDIAKRNAIDLQSDVRIALEQTFGPRRQSLVADDN